MPQTSENVPAVSLLQRRLDWSPVPRYCIAIAAACIAAVLSRIARNYGAVESEHGILVTAIAVAGWYGGRGPAGLATVLALLISGGFFTSPVDFLVGTWARSGLSLLLLLIEGALLSWISSGGGGVKGPAGPVADADSAAEWSADLAADSPATSSSASLSVGPVIDYQRIVDGVKGCAILSVDPSGRVASWTDAGERMTGFANEEIIGMPLSLLDVDVVNSGDAFRQAMQVARDSGNGTSLQRRCVRKDGTEFWADVVIGTILNDGGDLSGFTVVLRDITARKEEEALLEKRSRQLIEASRLKDEFLATVSHELRTPLNSILGWAQLFRAGKLDESGQAHALQTIEQSAKTQARLIEDLLDVSRIITGKMRLDVHSVQMTDVIEAAVETVRPAAEAKNISIQLMLEPAGCTVFGDPNRLQQIVWNVLSNAIKFTPPDGVVQVTLRRKESSVQVLVKDNGAGIDPEFLPQMFDAFRQADSSSTRSHKGLGLGLTIVRRLIELHGGTVRGESGGAGGGTIIEMTLPVATTPKSSAAISTIEPVVKPLQDPPISQTSLMTQQSLRVVVVDDDPEARELIATVLSQSGIEADVVGSAAEGLSAIERVKPDVVVSDIEMPVEDGYMFIHEVRALDAEHGGRTPAVALTAYTRAEDRRRTLAAGFQMHLGKPIEAEELVNAIMMLAGQRRKGNNHAQTARH